MSAVLRSLRQLILGETLTIPLGVASAIGLAVLIRGALPEDTWQAAGGFSLAALLVAALAWSLRERR
jgi:uncharacterized protein (TIGR03382 family)